MAKRSKQGARRTAKDWLREVRAWKRSGLTAKQYAESQGLSASALSWWSWRLKRDAKTAGEVQLVEVGVVGADPTADDPSWELTTACGDVLRVRGEMSVAVAEAVVAALATKVRS